ncbi:MAG: hypothetical protein ACOY4I_09185 [Bacillota bacterium]
MGREYSAVGASKLILSWHKAREELVYAEIQGFFRPGLHSAIIGSLSADLSILEGSRGIEAAALKLSADAFDLAAFTLSVAAGFKRLAGNIVFSGGPGSFFVDRICHVHCFSTETFSPMNRLCAPEGPQPAEKLPGILRQTIDNNIRAAGQTAFYYDISALAIPLQLAVKNIFDSTEFFRPETASIVLCKIFFPSLAGGVYRKLSGCAVVNKKKPGSSKAEGPLLYLPE